MEAWNNMGKNKIKLKKILVISPIPSHPQNAGDRSRVYNLLQNLKKFGHDVYFICENRETNCVEENISYKEMKDYFGNKFYLVPFRPKLSFAGKVSEHIDDIKGCVKLGEIKDIQKAYDLADVVICPVFLGTGLKIKLIEALGYCKPLVATPFAASGLEKGIGTSFLVARNIPEFVDAISKLFLDKRLYNKLSKNAYMFIKKYNIENFKNIKISSVMKIKNKPQLKRRTSLALIHKRKW